MSRTRFFLSLIAVGALASACDGPVPTATYRPSPKSDNGNGTGQFFTVMTQNTLHGTQIGIVLSAPASQIPLAVGRATSSPAIRFPRPPWSSTSSS